MAYTEATKIKIPDGQGGYNSYPIADIRNKRTRRNITSDLANLSAAVAEQNLEKYGYAIGDYFNGPSGFLYVLADLNNFKGGSGYTDAITYSVIRDNHLAIIVDTKQNKQWNTSNVTDTGYVGSALHAYLSGDALNIIKSDIASLFGGAWNDHLIAHQKLYRTNNNRWGWGWSAGQYISAMTSVQFHGSPICDMDGTDTGEGNKPLEVFQKYRFNEILGNRTIWLRSVSTAGSPCVAYIYGDAFGSGGASASYGAAGLIIFH